MRTGAYNLIEMRQAQWNLMKYACNGQDNKDKTHAQIDGVPSQNGKQRYAYRLDIHRIAWL